MFLCYIVCVQQIIEKYKRRHQWKDYGITHLFLSTIDTRGEYSGRLPMINHLFKVKIKEEKPQQQESNQDEKLPKDLSRYLSEVLSDFSHRVKSSHCG